MGRHRKRATTTHDVKNEEHLEERHRTDVVEKRIGLTKQVCMSCNSRNPEDADTCRKCDSSQLRQKANDFRQ